MSENWKVRKRNGTVYGPVDEETLKRWIQENRVLVEDYISPEGKEDWKRVGSLPQFTQPQEEVSTEKRCVYCGSILPAEAVFCTSCGTDLRTGKKMGKPRIKKQKNKFPIGIILILLILAVGGFFAYKYWGASRKKHQITSEGKQEQLSPVKPQVTPEETSE